MANIETSMSFTSTTQGGDKLQKAITDINPDAAGDKLVGFAQRLNALTTNTYTGATKIVKQELSSVAKTETTLTLYAGDPNNRDTLSAAKILADGYGDVYYDCNNHTGRIVITYNDTIFPILPMRDINTDDRSVTISFGAFDSEITNTITDPSQDYYVNGDTSKHPSQTGTIKFYVEETDTHTRSAEMTITINA